MVSIAVPVWQSPWYSVVLEYDLIFGLFISKYWYTYRFWLQIDSFFWDKVCSLFIHIFSSPRSNFGFWLQRQMISASVTLFTKLCDTSIVDICTLYNTYHVETPRHLFLFNQSPHFSYIHKHHIIVLSVWSETTISLCVGDYMGLWCPWWLKIASAS